MADDTMLTLDLESDPEGLDDLPDFLRGEVIDSLAGIAALLGVSAAGIAWKDRDGRARWLAPPLRPQTRHQVPSAQAFFDRSAGRPFTVPGATCESVALPGLSADARLCLTGPLSRRPRTTIEAALDSARLIVRLVRGARSLQDMAWQRNAASTVSEMLTVVLETRPLEETLGILARKIAEATGSQSVAIDSFPRGDLGAARNLYIDPAWEGWQENHKRWRELLSVRLRSLQEASPAELAAWRQWREAQVIADIQAPEIMASVPREEAEFYAETGLRTVVLQPLWVGNDFLGLMAISNRVVRCYSKAELAFIERMADVAAVAIRGAQLMTSLGRSRQNERQSYLESIARLAAAAEARDHTTGEHLKHLQDSVRLLAEALGLDDETTGQVVVASQLHDVGKITVPDSILLKPGPLTPQEREIVQRHTVDGEQLLTGRMLDVARQVARSHHERWDGTGYPDRLAGEDIPFPARIVAVADVYDALVSERPYKQAWPAEQAYREICREAGAHFDVKVVGAFRELWRAGAFN